MAMKCTRCAMPIVKGEKYHRTPKGPHHRTCLQELSPDPERVMNVARSTAWSAYQVLGCFFGIHGPARIMNWFWDIAHGEIRDTKDLFPVTPDEREKYSSKPSAGIRGAFRQTDECIDYLWGKYATTGWSGDADAIGREEFEKAIREVCGGLEPPK